ncbi:MAG: insulinase family protein [Spirochaetales bacterium]|nr:insulinase family protein [Spirochaetales bacterium]
MDYLIKEIGKETNGFKLINIYDLIEYKSIGYEYLHLKTGLKLFHIHNNDEENTFSFSFNTPTSCNCGTPHIIEHSVLSGSRLYDLKDPFQSMMTGSVNTFLNAYTFPDKTSYPASSVLEKDFFNLMSVYADAVFYPKLTKETFLQEGWRLTVDDENNLNFSGVVYNEMKGVYSSHDSIVADMSVKSLFDSGVYTWDSGGDPEFIPDLTYEEFLAFHKKWYSPSNCYVYLYGNIETEKSLGFLNDNFLKDFSLNMVAYQQGITKSLNSWSEPKSFHKYSPATQDKKYSSDLLLSWKLFDHTNPEEGLALEILNKILLGSSAAPLYKALSESDLWEDLSSSSGVENELCNYAYTVGVRGASPQDMDKFKEIVFDTLETLVTKGIDKTLIEGALRTVEFNNKEIHGSLGLRLMRKVIRGWLHGYSVITTLEFDSHMKSLREKSSNKGYFENLIKKYFINNKHLAQIVVEPSVKESKRVKERLSSRLSELKKNLSSTDLDNIKKENIRLKEYQDRPDSPEALEKLPRLSKTDIPSEVSNINTKIEDLEGFTYYKTDLYTNDIVYFGIGFNMEYLDKFFFEYLLIFSRMLTSTGFKGVPYHEVSKEVSLYLGGLGATLETSNTLKEGKPDRYIEYFYLRGKVLKNSLDEGFKLVIKFLTEVDFHDYKRLKSVITELRNDLKSSIIPNASSYAALRSARKFSLSSCREESWYGVTQVVFLEDLVKNIDDEGRLLEVATILDGIKNELLTKQALVFHSSSDPSYNNDLKNCFRKVIESLPQGQSFLHPAEHYDLHTNVEGMYGNSQVSYSGVTVKGAFLGTKEFATQALLAYILKTGYLWENVRMKGGAYGVFVSPSGLDGAITFGSYRDPHIKETLEHYKTSLEWIAAGHITQDEIDMALISVIGKELKPLTPHEKSIVGMKRKILGITNSIRTDKRKYLMETTVEDLMNFAAVLLHHFPESSTVVISSREALLEASSDIEGLEGNLFELPE